MAMNKSVQIVILCLPPLVLGGLLSFNARDDRFRHHCIDQKRVYANGSCLGLADPKQGAAAVKAPPKTNGQRSYDDLVAACERVGGWLASAITRDRRKTPRCTMPGANEADIDPPPAEP